MIWDLGGAAFGEGANARAVPLPQPHSIGSLEHFRFLGGSAHSFRHLLLPLRPKAAKWTMSLKGRFMGTEQTMGGMWFSVPERTRNISAVFQIAVSPEEKLSSNLLKSSVLSSQNEAVRALKWTVRLLL